MSRRRTIAEELGRLYGVDRTAPILGDIEPMLCEVPKKGTGQAEEAKSNTSSVILVAYGDHIQSGGQPGLQVLARALSQLVPRIFTHLHILPIVESSSDWGFAPRDHFAVDRRFGGWEDLGLLAERFQVVLDLVLNHVSSGHQWFQACLQGAKPFEDYFIRVPREYDFTGIAKSRHHPPITQYVVSHTPTNFWTRYGPDQVDLNYQNPLVLVDMLRILDFYMSKGISGVRLDALAFIWKKQRSSCANLDEVASILNIVAEFAREKDPQFQVISEVDASHSETSMVSIYGGQDVTCYRYELAPILLYLVLGRNSAPLKNWIDEMATRKNHSDSFNFLCTHDGIYLRPSDPPLDREAMQVLIDQTLTNGGHVVWREALGELRPYELDISIWNLLGSGSEEYYRRLTFLLNLVACLPGRPLVYLGTLMGLENDFKGVEVFDDWRALNRRKISLEELTARTKESNFQTFRIQLEQFFEARGAVDAFSSESAIESVDSEIVAFWRIGLKTSALCLFNPLDVAVIFPLKCDLFELVGDTKHVGKIQIDAGDFKVLMRKPG